MSSPWLSSLDWGTKQFRGKAVKSKTAMSKLLEEIEEFYSRRRKEFRSAGGRGKDIRVEFIICSLESLIPSRPVHMPGYPESVKC